MYTRICHMSIPVDRKEEFLDLQQEISDYYLDSMGGRIQFLRDMNEEENWLMIMQFESKDLYERRLGEVEDHLNDEDVLERLSDLLLTCDTPEQAKEYFMFMEVSAED
ncbi:hypothetical protein ABB02_00542 [Clostridiaceae bacterium JG1575]|nr:hypothetical protein ABB02_00542 [Clostridiaceae bacterium JG1575]